MAPGPGRSVLPECLDFLVGDQTCFSALIKHYTLGRWLQKRKARGKWEHVSTERPRLGTVPLGSQRNCFTAFFHPLTTTWGQVIIPIRKVKEQYFAEIFTNRQFDLTQALMGSQTFSLFPTSDFPNPYVGTEAQTALLANATERVRQNFKPMSAPW